MSRLIVRAATAVLGLTLLGCSPAAAGPNQTSGTSSPPPPTATPSGAPTPTPVATASEAAAAPQPPVEFTGSILCGAQLSGREGGSETIDVGDDAMVLTRERGGAWKQSAIMSDPRLEGDAYHTYEADSYRAEGAAHGPSIWVGTRRIENEAGAWVHRSYGGSGLDGTALGESGPSVYVGEGAYEGLIALMVEKALGYMCGVSVTGVIFSGAPAAEPYVP